MKSLDLVGVWVAVFLIGGVGAVLRLLVDAWVSGLSSWRLPFGTLVINLSGAFILGFLDGVALPKHEALIFGTGLIGAYTTFSTWMFETQRLSEERQLMRAFTNLWVSMVAGVGLGALGLWLGGLCV